MKKSTVFTIGIAVMSATPMAAGALSPLKMIEDAKHRVFEKASGSGSEGSRVKCEEPGANGMARISEMARTVKPGAMKAYGWYGSQWKLDDSYTYEYDRSGNITVENALDAEGDYARTVSEYDANNKVVFKETKTSSDRVTYSNYRKSKFAYDPILTNVITQRLEWMWMDDDWQLVGNNYRRTITRDDAGNITEVEIAVLFNDIFDPTQRLTVTYGKDGKADSIKEELLGYNGKEYYWEPGIQITDIVWERTDGQIYDAEDLFIGNNRIGSAHYMDGDDMDANITVEYADDSDAYVISMEMTMDDMTVTAKMEYTPLENDGYIAESATYFMGLELYSYREEYRYDDWGLMTLSYEGERDEDDEYYTKAVGEVEYDAEGRPLTYTISEMYLDERTGKEVSEYVIRAEYSDYMDIATGIEAVESVEKERRYDLNGLPVGADHKGIVIGSDRRVRIGK